MGMSKRQTRPLSCPRMRNRKFSTVDLKDEVVHVRCQNWSW